MKKPPSTETNAPSHESKAVASLTQGSSAPERPCFVVGIGASAGGQGALEQLFATMPSDCGISFVVIMHIPPDGPSFLAEMLGRYTSMAVVTATEGMELASNTVHVIPAGRDLTVSDGRLRLESREGTHHPIDRLFLSLAAELKERVVAVVLSGFGLDGSAGVKGVKDAGGIVIVQEPESAANPAMPRNAIATGVADFVLPAEGMPAKIAEIAHGTCSLPSRACAITTLDEELRDIFAIVKGVTGHDFSSYKANTVMRRVERRMAVNEVAGIKKYVALLRDNAQEAHALAQDILIGVTSFFRDPEAFETVRRVVIPRLFADRDPADPVRIWHACCATGEEVYSMAFLIREYLDEQRLDAKVQFFATDIDEAAIGQARVGLYDDAVAAEVGERRLRTFFTRMDDRWQVVKQVREMIVFAHHSLLKNPPFSRLDLLVCRNFLIYLNPDMQKRLFFLFHQVLKPGGCLFLGSAESVGRHSDLFAPVDKKWKIFERLEGARRGESLFPFTAPVRVFPGSTRLQRPAGAGEPSPGALAERLLMERYSPPCVVVNEKYEVVHVSTRTNRFLEVPVGEPTRDILKMAREELRPALRAAIYKVFAERRQIVFRDVAVSVAGGEATVNVLVEPLSVGPPSGNLAVVVFEPASPQEVQPGPAVRTEASDDGTPRDALIRQLEEQLRLTHEQLQATTEQLETSQEGFLSANEELLSMNEEYQSANEELQSTNEELETSKEELQALNEELVTVNAELQVKVEELNQLNSDMENLLASSEIATLFLDRQLNIRGFTPAATRIFNLLPADIGRPFRHLAGKIDWSGFALDAETVLAGEPFAEREVATLEGEGCYLKRIFPYRTAEGRIDGIVVTLIDITERKRAEEHIRHLASFPQLNPNPVLEVDLSGDLIFANPATERILLDLGMGREEAAVFIPADLAGIVGGWDRTSDATLYREVTVRERIFGETLFLTPLFDVIRIYGYDITERRRMEDALRRAKEEWERTFDSVPDLIAILDERHHIVRVNKAMAERLGMAAPECEGLRCFAAIHGTNCPPAFCPHAQTMIDSFAHQTEVREERLGGDFLVTTTPLFDENGSMTGSVHVARDITERKRAEEALRESEERVRRKLDSILTPEGDLGDLDLADVMDTRSLQSLVDNYYALTRMPMGLIDIEGKVLVGVGWQDICTKFHRVNPETCANCLESDLELSAGVPQGQYKIYKCKNNLWDVATPIFVGDRHFGNLFMGQFFFEDEEPDYELFRAQAKQYGFDEKEYIACLEAAPRLTREALDTSMAFFMELADVLSKLGYSNLKLARSLSERDSLMEELRRAHDELEVKVAQRTEELVTAVDVLNAEIFERERAEDGLRRLNRLYTVLSETDQAIVRACDRDSLFRDFCQIAVDHGGFLLAWVGLLDEESRRVEIVAAHGTTAYLDDILITTGNEPAGEGPTGISVREGTYFVCNDFQNDPCTRSWHEKGRAHGIRASASIALREKEQVVGALTLYAGEKDFFDEQHVALLRQMGADISFALDNFRREARRREVEEALQAETLERLRAVEELRDKERLLMQQSRLAAMGEMINNIAHQWRQPLNLLGLVVQELPLRYEAGGLSQEYLEGRSVMANELIRHMSQTIDDFRNFFRPDKEKVDFSVNEVVNRTLSLVGESFRTLDVAVELTMRGDPVINGYPNEYSQVLLNVLMNAKDAYSERNVPLPRVVTVTSCHESGRAVVTIADNAGGIPADIMEKIFDPYFTTKGPDKGTGVGLFMARTIIGMNMNGSITARNTDVGAEFRIEV